MGFNFIGNILLYFNEMSGLVCFIFYGYDIDFNLIVRVVFMVILEFCLYGYFFFKCFFDMIEFGMVCFGIL